MKIIGTRLIMVSYFPFQERDLRTIISLLEGAFVSIAFASVLISTSAKSIEYQFYKQNTTIELFS